VSVLAAFLIAAAAFFLIKYKVGRALEGTGRAEKPFGLVAMPNQNASVRWLAGGDVSAVAVTADSLWTAGSFGAMNEDGLHLGLPSIRVSAMVLWRGKPLAALEAGGLFLFNGSHWEGARTGFGPLQVRCLTEGAGGELYIGAKEGLFLVQWGGNTIERLHAAPVRSIALGPGVILAGGEDGLALISGGRVTLLDTPDPWIDWVGLRSGQVVLLTGLGPASGALDGEMRLLPLDAKYAAQLGDSIYFAGEDSILKMDADNRIAQEYLPQRPKRVFAAGGFIFVDTEAGLYKKGGNGWALIRPRPASLPLGSTHVTALAHFQNQLAVGTFDGGAAIGTWGQNGASDWRALPTANAWGINAILPSGGTLIFASLRGASRLEGSILKPVGPQGAAFSLAQSAQGIAIGYGQGTLLPGGQFLSAFHGLPGNQALALLQDDYLYVGTPSGLGAISGSGVAWRTVSGDGLLPHPWVTSLARYKNDVYIGTYGGGVARRVQETGQTKGKFEHFPETHGLKINAGCIAVFNGSLFVGTDGGGIYRLNADATRFERLSLPLPSDNVSALLPDKDSLLVGTNEGLARLPSAILNP
jgi:ligand-binding sensor domain-containing protein